MSKNLKSRNLSIMMTDIQGYTTTSASVSREKVIQLIRRHSQLMVPVIEFYGGKIIKTIGDAFLCTFESSTDAVICAIIIQLLLREYNKQAKDPAQKLNLRVVVNSGDVTLENNDIFGTAVNITARMEGLPCFPGGAIGISESTYLLMDKGEIVAEKVGPQQLKGIPEAINVYSVPIEKQKLTSLPVNLLELVELVVSGKGDGPDAGHASTAASNAASGSSPSNAALSNWNDTVVTFLKEKSWGENVKQLGQNIGKVQHELGRNISNVQSSIFNTLKAKTIVENGCKGVLLTASPATRFGCFMIDFGVMFLAMLVTRSLWWFMSFIFGDGLLGTLIWAALQFGIFFLYFAIFWKIRGATIGQIYGKCGVVKKDGSPLGWVCACTRSFLFLISTCLLGVGAWFILLGEEKEALYDKLSGTKVIE